MKISKNDALLWFDFFSQLPENEEISIKHEEIIYVHITVRRSRDSVLN